MKDLIESYARGEYAMARPDPGEEDDDDDEEEEEGNEPGDAGETGGHPRGGKKRP